MEPLEEQLSKAQIIEAFEQFVKTEDVWNHQADVKSWKQQIFVLKKLEEAAQLNAFEQKEDKEEGEEFELIADPLNNRWKELYNIYLDKIEARKQDLAEQEKQNLAKKEALVEDLKKLVEEDMQNVGSAFTTFYAIRDQWSATGQVNKSKFKQLQYDYSHYRDLFYYNVGIHDELKNYDFKKNAEQKQGIVAELKTLNQQDSQKIMEKGVKELQAKWDELGPTSNEVWEQLKNDYWDTVNSIYEKIKTYYKAVREKQAKVLEAKQALILQMEALIEELTAYSTPKQWIDSTSKVNELHTHWKAAGFLGKSKEEGIWVTFKQLSDEVRNQKNVFFDNLKKDNHKVVEAKNKLIEQAESLQDSTDWKKTSEELIALQKKWKLSGRGQHRTDQKQWEQFRAACDSFFTTKKNYFDTLDDRQETNFKAKEVLAEKIAKSKTEEELKALIVDWQVVDYVPKNKINAAESAFKKAIESAAKELKINTNDLSMLQFEAKVSAIKDDPKAASKVKVEKEFIQTHIDKIKEEIHRFEENMGFFGHSKGSQKLKEIVEKRLEDSQAQLEEWREKMDMLS